MHANYFYKVYHCKMGNCMAIPRAGRRGNRVEPATSHVDNIHEVLSKSTTIKKASLNEPADMAKALKAGETEDRQEVPEPVAEKAAVSFVVEIGYENTTPIKMPKRLTERLSQSEKELQSEIEYTAEEDALMAEILRDDVLKQRQEKARNEDVKIFDAKRRRLVIERSREAQLEHKLRGSTPSVTDQRQKAKDLAEEDRRKAVVNRKAAGRKE